ncbi:MAG: permease [Porticoccaceae bacterium]
MWLATASSGIYELMNTMWWGLLMAIFFVGLLERLPRELIMGLLGQGGSLVGICRATFAGVLLDLCSHGILMVGTKLYQRGASLGQLMAFLIASPWNSLSLTIVLIALIGWGWTLLFIAASMLIGIVSGLLFDRLVAAGKLPQNPNTLALPSVQQSSVKALFAEAWQNSEKSWKGLVALLVDGLRGSKMVFRWLFFGLLLAVAVRALVPLESYQMWFGPTLAGLFATLLAATIIEVCSEGSTPIAADIVTRAAAPGNGFTFLMAGVATDYTEIMVLRDLTGSWKIALFLPLITLPQVVLIGALMNLFVS